MNISWKCPAKKGGLLRTCSQSLLPLKQHSYILGCGCVFTHVLMNILKNNTPADNFCLQNDLLATLWQTGCVCTCQLSTHTLFNCISLVVKDKGRCSASKLVAREPSFSILRVFDYFIIQWNFYARSFWLQKSTSMPLSVLKNVKDCATTLSIQTTFYYPVLSKKKSMKIEKE